MESKLKEMIKIVTLVTGLGVTLVTYADNKFATKSMLELVFEKLQVIDARVYDIHKTLNSKDN